MSEQTVSCPVCEVGELLLAHNGTLIKPCIACGNTRTVIDMPTVTVDAKGNVLLPPVPHSTDVVGLLEWLTAVFSLDGRHPITGGVREGLRGPEGHVALTRAGAPTIRFEPAARINQPQRLVETLSWSLLPTDRAVHAFKAAHCREIAHVIRMLCGVCEELTAEQEAAGIVATMTIEAVAVHELTTYGTGGQRYEAAVGLRRLMDEHTGRATGPRRYLVDAFTGELVISTFDMHDAARRHTGSSLPHGWVDGRMQALGWERIVVDGHQLAGRNGRRGPHARVSAYRGLLPHEDDGDHVTTPFHAPTRENEQAHARARIDVEQRGHVVTGPDGLLVDAIKREFDAVEMDADEWAAYLRDHDVEDWRPAS